VTDHLSLPIRPPDATLTVTKAARLLGVHPNTVRAWSDQGRLRYYRINPRGDRRYRLGDLQRFLAVAEGTAEAPLPPTSGLGRRGFRATPSASIVRELRDPVAGQEPHEDLVLLALLADIVASGRELEAALAGAARTIREHWGLSAVGVWERSAGRLIPRAMSGAARPNELPEGFGVLGRALELDRPVFADRPGAGSAAGSATALLGRGPELALPIPGRDAPWGVLWLAADGPAGLTGREAGPAEAASRIIAGAVRAGHLADDVAHQLHRADALRRVASDIGSRLDVDRILTGLVDHAMVLFEADRAAVFLSRPDGSISPEVSRGLSTAYLAAIREFPTPSLPAEAVAARRPLFAIDYANDPRGAGVRAAVVQEGFDTLCTAPLLAGEELLGLLNVYHDRPHAWSSEELETMAAFAAQASVAIKAAQDFRQMATRAAQLQSIQALGARLSSLGSVREIGIAIATELHQLIDYHNVRVYRVEGEDLLPVAMQGQVGIYEDETADQLRLRVGEGITGWVAGHGIAQYLPDAAADPRAQTIPGTEDDLDESMLLAPMVIDDKVLGVLVLSKLGLHQFSADDLRLLDIYASFAAQAMANADATERLRAQSDALEHQLERQRELLRVTESILSELDTRSVVDRITDRLGSLVHCDNIAIEVVGPDGLLAPLTARGVHAAEYLEPWAPGETGLATWVVEHGEPQLVLDSRADPRVNRFRGDEALDASLIVVPLRDRDGVSGVMALERLGLDDPFTTDEFELVQLFAAHVSIALRNAASYSAAEVRTSTDDRTGLLNHAAFELRLERSVGAGEPFGLIMADLDDFKAVNDKLGHQAGDRFLREVGGAIAAAGRDSDLVFRYGGDEFTLLLPGATAAGARSVAERVRRAVEAAGRSMARSDGLRIGASIGYATFPLDGTTPAAILLAADRACFVAKRDGRNRVASAADGRALGAESGLQEPTPIDPPTDGAEVDAPRPKRSGRSGAG
jgi:diguanylate cyclase (GGDEF)-like protein/excisionase family DNA binding protein